VDRLALLCKEMLRRRGGRSSARGPRSDGATSLDFSELNCIGGDVTICNQCVVMGSDDAGDNCGDPRGRRARDH
jgi:hypothetical protein